MVSRFVKTLLFCCFCSLRILERTWVVVEKFFVPCQGGKCTLQDVLHHSSSLFFCVRLMILMIGVSFKCSWNIWAQCKHLIVASFLSYRLVTNKLLLGIIILMELAILGAVIYLKFFRKWADLRLSCGSRANSDSICLYWLSSSNNNTVLLFSAICVCDGNEGLNSDRDSVHYLMWMAICQLANGPNLQKVFELRFALSLDAIDVLQDDDLDLSAGCYRSHGWFFVAS